MSILPLPHSQKPFVMWSPGFVMESLQLCDVGLSYPLTPRKNSHNGIQMENLPSLLESIYTTWLSLSSTIWAMDMILAFVCGLGLYLLLLPFLESHLSSTPSNIKFTRKVRNSQLNLTEFSLFFSYPSLLPPTLPLSASLS